VFLHVGKPLVFVPGEFHGSYCNYGR
jgi:hypothetical protein